MRPALLLEGTLPKSYFVDIYEVAAFRLPHIHINLPSSSIERCSIVFHENIAFFSFYKIVWKLQWIRTYSEQTQEPQLLCLFNRASMHNVFYIKVKQHFYQFQLIFNSFYFVALFFASFSTYKCASWHYHRLNRCLRLESSLCPL